MISQEEHNMKARNIEGSVTERRTEKTPFVFLHKSSVMALLGMLNYAFDALAD